MASPQIENGYTKIANELIEAFSRIRIPGEVGQIIWVVFRKTYGFSKKNDHISLSQFCLSTSMRRSDVCRAINKATSMNVLKVISKKANGIGNVYCINKDFDSWNPLAKKQRGVAKKQMTISKKANNHTLKSDIQKKKETITKETPSPVGDWVVVSSILELFREVNPSVNILFSRKPEHEAIRRLVKTHGEEKLRSIIAYLPKSNASAYAPTITSPSGLERDLGKLIAWSQKQKSKLTEKEVIVAF